MLVEQAIFTSAATVRGEGYQIVAASRGVSEADAQVLALWGPSHGALLEEGPGAQSIQFQRLPSGAYSVARTRPMGEEYSGRRGERIHTHCLILSPDAFARFSNNPFAVLQAAVAGGRLLEAERAPEGPLEPLPLLGRAGVCQEALVERVAAEWGPAALGGLIDAVLQHRCVGLCGGGAEERIAATLNCLPLECRGELSFATGLKFSPQRPFRLMAVGSDRAEQQRLARQFEATLVDLEALTTAPAASPTSWGSFVARLLATRGASGLTSILVRPRPGLTCDDLPELARENKNLEIPTPAVVAVGAKPQITHAHAAHRRRPTQSAAAAKTITRPAKTLGANPKMIEQLEALDDAVYESIAGKPGAFDELARLWPNVLEQLEPKLVDQSREQYLRYAIRVWEEFLGEANAPEKAVAALDVLCLLFEADEAEQ